MRYSRIKKRLLWAVIILTVAAILAGAVFFYQRQRGEKGDLLSEHGNRKETVNLWYTDDALTDYLSSKALEFYENTDIRVVVRLVSGLEYLEAVNAASLDDGIDTPDLYILSNDSLEKAYLAGLATQLPDTAPVYEEQLFPQSARDAVQYNGKYVACPMYFETSALLYNKTYLQQIADEAEQLIPASIVDILTYACLLYTSPSPRDS